MHIIDSELDSELLQMNNLSKALLALLALITISCGFYWIRIPISKTPNKIHKIYVINLERSKDRREKMDTQLRNIGLDYEFFKAVEGKELKFINEAGEVIQGVDINHRKRLGETYKILCPNVTITYKNNHINGQIGAGVAGCYCSHLELWRKIRLEGGNALSIVLEDDVRLSGITGEKLNTLTNAFIDEREASIISLGLHYKAGIGRKMKTFKFIPFSDIRKLSHPFQTTHAYAITKSGINAMFSKLTESEVGGVDYNFFKVIGDGIKDKTVNAYKADNMDILQNQEIPSDMLN